MKVCGRIVAVVLLLSLPLAAEANGFRRASPPISYYSFYPAPLVYVPAVAYVPLDCVLVAPTMAVPGAPPRLYATPSPAPPLAAPPLTPPPGTPPTGSTPPPGVKETRNYFDAYAVAVPEGKAVDGQRCGVGFWNNTGQALVLRVAGEARTLPPGKGITLELPRDFVWQVGNREPRTERVPAEQAGMEIVIRK